MFTVSYKSVATAAFLLTYVLKVFATPNVGIQQDWRSEHPALMSFSAIMRFNPNADGSNPVDALSDAQLVALSSKAYDEMNTLWRALPPNDRGTGLPGVMATIAIKNEIYFASSINSDRQNWLGIGKDKTKPQELEAAAGGCRLGGLSHKMAGGSCGEVNLMDLYFSDKGELNFKGSGSRIVPWSGQFKTNINPCMNAGDRYGCDTFLRAITNPDDKNAHLDNANMKVVQKCTAPDTNWPNGVTFKNGNPRLSVQGICAILDDPYDPNNPELRRLMPRSLGKALLWHA